MDRVEQEYFKVWKTLNVPNNYPKNTTWLTDTSKLKIAVVGGIQLNLAGGNNEHTRNYSNNGILITPGIMFQNMVSLSVPFGIQKMAVNTKYGPEYSNIFNTNTHEYYLGQLFIEMRFFPLKGKVSPVLFGGYGTGSGLFSTSLGNGAMFNAGAGVEFRTSSKTKLDLSYTYQYQELAYDSYANDHSSIPRNKGTLYLSYAGLNIDFLIHFGLPK